MKFRKLPLSYLPGEYLLPKSNLEHNKRRKKISICRGSQDDSTVRGIHSRMSQHTASLLLSHLAEVEAQLVHCTHLESWKLLLLMKLNKN